MHEKGLWLKQTFGIVTIQRALITLITALLHPGNCNNVVVIRADTMKRTAGISDSPLCNSQTWYGSF